MAFVSRYGRVANAHPLGALHVHSRLNVATYSTKPIHSFTHHIQYLVVVREVP